MTDHSSSEYATVQDVIAVQKNVFDIVGLLNKLRSVIDTQQGSIEKITTIFDIQLNRMRTQWRHIWLLYGLLLANIALDIARSWNWL